MNPKSDRKISSASQSNRSVTIKDLARELKLSITTISRALNGYSDVGKETRQRVVDAARTHGYRPNRNAQRLVTQRTHNIAWVQADNDLKFVDPHFVEVMAGVLRGARAGKYDIVLTSETPEHQIATYDRYVKDNSVDGFIVDLPQINDARISFLLEAQRPFVAHGRDGRSDQYGWVDIDNFGIYYDLTRLMVANGHQNIAFINGDENFAFAVNRRRGVEAALDDMGLDRDKVKIFSTVHPMSDAGYQLTERALEDSSRTAILYSSTLMAVEGNAAIVQAGRRAGDNLAVGTIDDQLHYIDLSPFDGQFTLVRSSLRDAGVLVVEELIRQCEKKAPPSGTLVPHVFELANGIDPSVLDTPTRIDGST
jgi:LacI family transcriptional regulator